MFVVSLRPVDEGIRPRLSRARYAERTLAWRPGWPGDLDRPVRRTSTLFFLIHHVRGFYLDGVTGLGLARATARCACFFRCLVLLRTERQSLPTRSTSSEHISTMRAPAFQQCFNFSVLYQPSRIPLQKRDFVFRCFQHLHLVPPERADNSLP